MVHDHQHGPAGQHEPHPHPHAHHHGPNSYERAFAIGLTLNLAIVVGQATFGVLANSLALIADAGHNLADVLALILAWSAIALSRRTPTLHRTYGWRRSTILATLVNALVLILVTLAIAAQAVRRLADPSPIAATTVIWVAAGAAVLNGLVAALFMAGRERDMNIRGAFMHMAADAALSFGVVLAGCVILATGWVWLDAVTGLVIGAAILAGTWGLLRDALNLSLDAVPAGIDMPAVQAYLAALPGVVGIHDLHVWAMSTTETALTAHLVVAQATLDDALLAEAIEELDERFGIEHTTLQVEHGDPNYQCIQAEAHAV